MNRRDIIRGMVASTILPALPAAAAAESLETQKREALRLLLSLSEQGAFELHMLKPLNEVYEHVQAIIIA